MRRPDSLSAAAARRIALAAQGFARSRPEAPAGRRHGRKLFEHVGIIQVDSVNVVTRSQELPVFARLGAHRRDLLTSMVAADELFEYWAHEASLVPIAMQPLLRWRMDEARSGNAWSGLVRFANEHGPYIEAVLAEVRERGPIAAGSLSDPGERGGPWWGWNRGKRALEYLFWCGDVTATRTSTFERVYRIAPASFSSQPTPSPSDARRELVARSARSLGIATVADLADYFRLRTPDTKVAVDQLVEDGRLVVTEVEGWKAQAYRWVDATAPRNVTRSALLSPFDSLVWDRKRTERMFSFRYRIEIYTPAPKRIYGYYVMPFLWNGDIVARVDLKADRQAGVLRVPGAFSELGVPTGPVAEALSAELTEMATWLGLGAVAIGSRGDLAQPLSDLAGNCARV